MDDFRPDEKMLDDDSGKRDYFWVVIVLGIVIVTVGALYTGSYLAKVFLNKDKTVVVTDIDEVSEDYDNGITVKGASKETKDRIGRIEGAVPKPVKSAPVPTEKKKAPEKKKAAAHAVKTDPAPEKITKTAPPADPEQITIETKSVVEIPEEKLYNKKQKVAPEADKKTPETAPKEKIQAQPVVEPVVEPVAKPVAKPVKEKVKNIEQKDAPEGSIYVLQLGNFKDEENANRFKEKVEAEVGIEVYVARVDVEGESRYRVQVGAFRDKKNAQKLGREIQVLGYSYYINAREK